MHTISKISIINNKYNLYDSEDDSVDTYHSFVDDPAGIGNDDGGCLSSESDDDDDDDDCD